MGQGLDQEQVMPATKRMVTKCFIEGCSFDTIQELGEWDHGAQCPVSQDLHSQYLVMHLQGAHMSWEGTSPYETQPPPQPSNVLQEPVGHATHPSEPAGQLPVEIEQESAGHANDTFQPAGNITSRQDQENY